MIFMVFLDMCNEYLEHMSETVDKIGIIYK